MPAMTQLYRFIWQELHEQLVVCGNSCHWQLLFISSPLVIKVLSMLPNCPCLPNCPMAQLSLSVALN